MIKFVIKVLEENFARKLKCFAFSDTATVEDSYGGSVSFSCNTHFKIQNLEQVVLDPHPNPIDRRTYPTVSIQIHYN